MLYLKKVRTNKLWKATMTPLASIIGSGFLIAAPILDKLGGESAPYLMILLCVVSFCIGEVIRWNIKDVEPLLKSGKTTRLLEINEKVCDVALCFAYVLSITYYLYLFSSFLLKMLNYSNPFNEKITVSIVLLSIAFIGHRKGLSSLERVETISVNIKLSIIITFLFSLFLFYIFKYEEIVNITQPQFRISDIGIILGLLIMVQGFETSRYLSEDYNPQTRVKSMRYAQIISSFIYILLIILFIPVFKQHPLGEAVSETSVIDVGKYVFLFAPGFLYIAAMMSQLSASVADMGGSGGLVSEVTKSKISSKNAYLIISTLGVLVVWIFDIFEVISYASKAFAAYYFLQAISSIIVQYKKNNLKLIFSTLIAALCIAIVIFGKPFE
jgi:hypothetical protein